MNDAGLDSGPFMLPITLCWSKPGDTTPGDIIPGVIGNMGEFIGFCAKDSTGEWRGCAAGESGVSPRFSGVGPLGNSHCVACVGRCM